MKADLDLASLFGLASLGALVLTVMAARWPRRHVPTSAGVLLVGGVGLVWALGVWSFLLEPDMLVVRRLTIESPAWRGPPLRIGLISDTHGGAPHGRASRLQAVMQRMNAERPDIVLLAGDYAGRHEPAPIRDDPRRSPVQAGIATFRGLRAPLGVHGVLGNHDVWYDEASIRRGLRRAGVRVLSNNAVRVNRRGGAFWVAGLPSLDSQTERPRPSLALADVPSGEPVVMLMHEPDAFERMPPGVALALAGHTHCGQVNLPGIGRPILPSEGSHRRQCGLYRAGVDRLLYVTGGVGVSILPVRFNQPPEIAVITLRAPARQPRG